jgi:hypothetical protein
LYLPGKAALNEQGCEINDIPRLISVLKIIYYVYISRGYFSKVSGITQRGAFTWMPY